MHARVMLLVCLLGLLLLPGCGQPTLARVKGRVTCNGKPVVDAALIFSPLPQNEGDRESGKAASAATDADGRYEVSTHQRGDGALIGKHRIAITLEDTARLPCKSKVILYEVKPGEHEFNIELNQK